MKFLDIGEISRRSAVPPSALRYYEEKGLIQPLARRGLRRQYDPSVLLQLSLIALGKNAGFTLSEIAAMFSRKGKSGLPRDLLRSRADDLERQIEELTILQKTLRHVAECPHPSHLQCPRFRKLLKVASRDRPSRG